MAQRFSKSIFFPPKDKKLASMISIRSPTTFKNSIKRLSKNGITLKEKRALNLAKTRAVLQLRRPNLSSKERGQFAMIASMPVPKVTRR